MKEIAAETETPDDPDQPLPNADETPAPAAKRRRLDAAYSKWAASETVVVGDEVSKYLAVAPNVDIEHLMEHWKNQV